MRFLIKTGEPFSGKKHFPKKNHDLDFENGYAQTTDKSIAETANDMGYRVQELGDYFIGQLDCHGFRGLNEFQLSTPGRFNLLVGPNNSGKTSVLEALYFSVNHNLIEALEKTIRVRIGRDNPGHSYSHTLESFVRAKWLFAKSNTKITTKINSFEHQIILELKEMRELLNENLGEIDLKYLRYGVEKFATSVSFSKQGGGGYMSAQRELCPISYIHPSSHKDYNSIVAYDKASKEGLDKFLIEILQVFDPKIKSVRIGLNDYKPNETILEISHASLITIPIVNFGDGLQKAFELATIVLNCKNGILLIDEFESNFHPRALHSISSWFINLIERMNIQVFATTHSLECIDALIDGVDESQLKDIVLYRMAKDEDRVKVKRFDGNELKYVRHEIGADLRVVG